MHLSPQTTYAKATSNLMMAPNMYIVSISEEPIIKGQSELAYECITRTYNELPITHLLRGLSSVSSL